MREVMGARVSATLAAHRFGASLGIFTGANRRIPFCEPPPAHLRPDCSATIRNAQPFNVASGTAWRGWGTIWATYPYS